MLSPWALTPFSLTAPPQRGERIPFYTQTPRRVKGDVQPEVIGGKRGRSRPPYDAADDGSATDGPDMTWQIFPVVVTATKDGYRRLPGSESAGYAQQVVDGRMTLPDGPPAPLRLVSPANLQ